MCVSVRCLAVCKFQSQRDEYLFIYIMHAASYPSHITYYSVKICLFSIFRLFEKMFAKKRNDLRQAFRKVDPRE